MVTNITQWYDDPEVIKRHDFMVLESGIISRTNGVILYFPELVEELKQNTDFSEDDIKYSIWRLLGAGTLIRINDDDHFTLSPMYVGYAFTTISKKTRGIF